MSPVAKAAAQALGRRRCCVVLLVGAGGGVGRRFGRDRVGPHRAVGQHVLVGVIPSDGQRAQVDVVAARVVARRASPRLPVTTLGGGVAVHQPAHRVPQTNRLWPYTRVVLVGVITKGSSPRRHKQRSDASAPVTSRPSGSLVVRHQPQPGPAPLARSCPAAASPMCARILCPSSRSTYCRRASSASTHRRSFPRRATARIPTRTRSGPFRPDSADSPPPAAPQTGRGPVPPTRRTAPTPLPEPRPPAQTPNGNARCVWLSRPRPIAASTTTKPCPTC